jgi:arabinogalactan oligomer/maltooligosaccharide transport system permease protein
VLKLAQVLEVQGEVTELRVPFSEDPNDGWVRTQTGTVGFQSSPRYAYDEAADTFTDVTSGTVFSPNDRGFFEAADGTRLTPGWPVTIGFENFERMFSDSRVSSALLQAGAWTTTFFLGLFLAMTFNHPAVRGRKVIRSLLILPYAFPGFLAALVWRGMLNNPYGFINSTVLGGADIPWLTEEWLARFSILAVNLWLGFPYMFLIATGALQAVPGDVYEAAKIDGAKPFRQFRSITLPLLMISVAPLLIASFSFNFNNFNLIYFVTGGGPNIPGHPLALGETDILISVVYKVAVVAGTKQYGLAAAMSILVFVIVGLVSWLGFRQTRKLEEVL